MSNKGLKIIQNVTGKRAHENYRVNHLLLARFDQRPNPPLLQENVKHFIPHHAITCAVQGSSPNEDVVSTILLIYNPATACPVHVHSYRCDSPETAQLLQEQLQVEKLFFLVDKLSRCWWIGRRTRKSSSRSSLGYRRRVSCSETHHRQAAQSSAPMVAPSVAALTLELARIRAASSTPARRSPPCKTT